MPIYEYYCECGCERDEILPFADFDKPQVCGCGMTMEHKMSHTSFTMKLTGNQMALDTLNSGVVGGKRKAWAEQNGYSGINNFKKEVW